MKNSLILLMAGNGSRCGLEINKVLYRINQVPLFIYSLEKFNQVGFDEYILVVFQRNYLNRVCYFGQEQLLVKV